MKHKRQVHKSSDSQDSRSLPELSPLRLEELEQGQGGKCTKAKVGDKVFFVCEK